MTEEEKKIRNKANEIIKKIIPSPKGDLEEFYVSCMKVACIEMVEQQQQENNRLAQHIVELQKDKGNLIDKVRNLEEQIEKTKKCAICKYAGGCGICLNNEECHNKDKFELVE